MIQGTVVGGEAAVARFDSMPGRLRQELLRGVGRAVLLVQRDVKESKLSGQVLNVRTGRLRRSINTSVTGSTDVVVGTVGTNVSYAHAQEYGFRGVETVREHLRTTKRGAMAMVRSFQRNANIPEHSFLRSSLQEMQPQIRQEFQDALSRAMKS